MQKQEALMIYRRLKQYVEWCDSNFENFKERIINLEAELSNRNVSKEIDYTKQIADIQKIALLQNGRLDVIEDSIKKIRQTVLDAMEGINSQIKASATPEKPVVVDECEDKRRYDMGKNRIEEIPTTPAKQPEEENLDAEIAEQDRQIEGIMKKWEKTKGEKKDE